MPGTSSPAATSGFSSGRPVVSDGTYFRPRRASNDGTELVPLEAGPSLGPRVPRSASSLAPHLQRQEEMVRRSFNMDLHSMLQSPTPPRSEPPQGETPPGPKPDTSPMSGGVGATPKTPNSDVLTPQKDSSPFKSPSGPQSCDKTLGDAPYSSSCFCQAKSRVSGRCFLTFATPSPPFSPPNTISSPLPSVPPKELCLSLPSPPHPSLPLPSSRLLSKPSPPVPPCLADPSHSRQTTRKRPGARHAGSLAQANMHRLLDRSVQGSHAEQRPAGAVALSMPHGALDQARHAMVRLSPGRACSHSAPESTRRRPTSRAAPSHRRTAPSRSPLSTDLLLRPRQPPPCTAQPALALTHVMHPPAAGPTEAPIPTPQAAPQVVNASVSQRGVTSSSRSSATVSQSVAQVRETIMSMGRSLIAGLDGAIRTPTGPASCEKTKQWERELREEMQQELRRMRKQAGVGRSKKEGEEGRKDRRERTSAGKSRAGASERRERRSHAGSAKGREGDATGRPEADREGRAANGAGEGDAVSARAVERRDAAPETAPHSRVRQSRSKGRGEGEGAGTPARRMR